MNRRNDYRVRDSDTRANTVELAIPKLHNGSYFPEWLGGGVAGPSSHWSAWWPPPVYWGCRHGGWTSWWSRWAAKGIAKSQVSEMSKVLDAPVAAFRNRPLEGGPYAFVWVDALPQKVL